MRIKRYVAPDIATALHEVRSELGADALLLEVRRVRRGVLARLGLRPPWVEVLAACDGGPASLPARPSVPARPAAPRGSRRSPACPEPDRVAAAGPPRAEEVPVTGGGSGRIVAVVGPTGAGKTTSLAKLAALAAVVEGRRTALITLDTFRVGAVEQLKTYAEIMGVPLYVVDSPAAMASALEACAGAERVFIDTPGRHPLDRWAMARTRRLLEAARPDEVHLVIPAYARPVDAVAYAPAYRELGADRLLITKLDETAYPVALRELPRRLGLPVSYLAFGQEVPDDIAPATPEAVRRHLAQSAPRGEGRCWA